MSKWVKHNWVPHNWTPEEIQKLKELYPITKSKDLEDILQKTADTIRHKASRLRIKANNRKAVDIERLRYLYWDKELSSSEIAEIEGVTDGAILSRLKRCGILVRKCNESLLLRYKRKAPKRGSELPYYGRKPSIETRKKWSIQRKGRKLSVVHSLAISVGTKRAWANPERKAKRLISMYKALHKTINKSENILLAILQDNFPNEWRYVGDGQIIIAGKIPDFINIDHKKQVIELFGNYYHSPKFFPNRFTEEELISHYKKYGFSCLIIWESELSNPPSIAQRIKKWQVKTLTKRLNHIEASVPKEDYETIFSNVL